VERSKTTKTDKILRKKNKICVYLLKKSKIIQILGVYMADYDYQYWYNEIAQYDRAFKKWEGRAEKIVKRYRDDSRSQNNPTSRFNILWSNVQTVTPAIFARLPKPDVS